MLEKAVIEIVPDYKERDGRKELTVQFNPSELRFHSMGGMGVLGEENGVRREQKAEQHARAFSTALFFELQCEGENTKQQLNGFLGLKLEAGNVRVAFCWGENRFEGRIADVSGEYTVFDREGRPIRGKVSITIQR